MRLAVRDRYLSMHQLSFLPQFSFVSHMHIHISIKNVLAETVFVVFQEIQCLHNFNHDDVRRVTELYLFHVCQCCG